jgi:hypothetical protein
MKSIDTIRVEISGPTQSGKSAIMETIRECLANDYGLAVVFSNKEDRVNPPSHLAGATVEERPNPDASVVVLIETNESRGDKRSA